MTNSSIPVPISGVSAPTPLTVPEFATVTAGGDHACAATSFGVPEAPLVGGVGYCWGGNTSGQLGNGTMTTSTTFVAVAGGLNFATVSAGGSHTCGVTSSNPPSSPTAGGGVYCWGDNTYGQLGNSWTKSRFLPVNVAGSP